MYLATSNGHNMPYVPSDDKCANVGKLINKNILKQDDHAAE